MMYRPVGSHSTSVHGRGRPQTRVVSAGGSYLSSNSLRQHFGLGEAERVDTVQIDWPSGDTSQFRDLAADRLYRIEESPVPPSDRPEPTPSAADDLHGHAPNG